MTTQEAAIFVNNQAAGNSSADLINQILLKRLQAEETETEAKRQENLKIQRENARLQEEKRLADVRRQSECAHTKPNGTSHLIALRNNFGETMFLCQGCQKEFSIYSRPAATPEEQAKRKPSPPAHLMIARDTIGGPVD
jgi:hypothetical protein